MRRRASDPQDESQYQGEEAPLLQVVELAVALLQTFALQADLVEAVEDPIESAGPVACVVRGGRGSHHVAAEPAVEGGGPALGQRPLDVAEENDAVVFGGVFRVVDEGFIEHHRLAVAPVVALAVHLDEAGRVVGVNSPRWKRSEPA